MSWRHTTPRERLEYLTDYEPRELMKPLTHKDYWTEIRRIAEEFRCLMREDVLREVYR